MRLKELKCINCGAKLKVNPEDEMATCQYCKTRFSVESAYNDGYKYQKGVLDAQQEHMDKQMDDLKKSGPFKFVKIFIIIVTSIIIISFLTTFIFIFGGFSHLKNNSGIIGSQIKSSFNNYYENHIGKQSGFWIESLINEVIENNTTNSRKITITFEERIYTTTSELKEVLSSIDNNKDYFVELEYTDGYVSNIIITNM